MDNKRLKSILFYALTGIMFSILILLVFYNDYNYGMAALAIYTLIIIFSYFGGMDLYFVLIPFKNKMIFKLLLSYFSTNIYVHSHIAGL